MRLNRLSILVICVFCWVLMAVPAMAGRTISLPFEEKFDSGDTWTRDLLWVSGGGSGTHILSGGGCWSGGCAKFTPPTGAGNHASLGQFVGLNTTRLNIRFLIKFGTTWALTPYNKGEGIGDKLIIVLTSAGSRPMAILQKYTDGVPNYFSLGPCDGTVCKNECGGVTPCYWPNGRDRFRINDGASSSDYAGKWVVMEHETDLVAGTIKLYIWTMDGALSGLYETQTRTGGGIITAIDLIGGYYNQSHSADPNTYMMIDELKIDNKFIGPPAGFVGTPGQALAPPAGLRIYQ